MLVVAVADLERDVAHPNRVNRVDRLDSACRLGLLRADRIGIACEADVRLAKLEPSRADPLRLERISVKLRKRRVVSDTEMDFNLREATPTALTHLAIVPFRNAHV